MVLTALLKKSEEKLDDTDCLFWSHVLASVVLDDPFTKLVNSVQAS